MARDPHKSKKILLKELSSVLTCTLCGGYFIDATTLVDCLHVFCRSCIIRHFENSKLGCPTCSKKKATIRPDPQMQALVYKMVPGLFSKEMQRREDFHRTTTVRASSSCSDDSVLGDMKQDQEKWVLTNTNYTTTFYSPEDSISLSLEYYQYHLDKTVNTKVNKNSFKGSAINKDVTSDDMKKENGDSEVKKDKEVRDRRYLQCPAAVSMSHLQKFLRMKYALSQEHKVDIIYEGEVLPSDFNLMDVAYSFKWTKVKPMRFFYRIFTPLKIQPIKIINTSSPTGGKQLQIVPVKPSSDSKPQVQDHGSIRNETDQQTKQNKERLMAHLKLQSKHNPPAPETSKQKIPEPACVYEYEEPDKEEIKRFAENRDREWARMRQEEQQTHHVSKKRKKNKHSKGDVNHKKRKLHAQITSDIKQESMKLKVKLTPHNGHKHKHHRTPQIIEPPKAEKINTDQDISLQTKVVKPKSSVTEEKIAEPPKSEEMPKPIKKDDISNKDKAVQSTSGTQTSELSVTPIVTKESKSEDVKAKQTFLKTFQSHADKTAKAPEKVATNKIEKKAINTYSKPNHQNQMKLLERKIETLQKQCAMEAKKDIGKTNSSDKPHILNSQYASGFTVSKIETGVKRKAEPEETVQDKRPSLEITLINPQPQTETKPVAKRPPPATIPLERIKKSINLKTGISIIPKLPDRCDNIGALDLSKPNKPESPTKPNGITLNGMKDLKALNNLTKINDKNSQLSNLQMLSKVASEHSSLNKSPGNNGKSRPQIPNLHNFKFPSPQNPAKPNNLAKLPKLNEINKAHIRLLNNTQQMRTVRPTQNQSIRNIPNPSALVRQQNQNRLNLSLQNGDSKEPKILNSLAKENHKDKVVEDNKNGKTKVENGV